MKYWGAKRSQTYVGIAICGTSRDWWPINLRAVLWMLAALQQIVFFFKCNYTTKLKILTFLSWISTTEGNKLSVKQSCLSYKRSICSGLIFVVLCVCVCVCVCVCERERERDRPCLSVSDWQCSEVKFSLGDFTNYAEIWPLHNVCNIQMFWLIEQLVTKLICVVTIWVFCCVRGYCCHLC